jgi:transposase-like protein
MSGEQEDAGMPRLVRRKVLAVVPRLCPRCLSQLRPGSELGGWLTPQDYICPSCGYRGFAFLEATPDKPAD